MVALVVCRTAEQDDAVKRLLTTMAKVSKPKSLPPTGSSAPVMVRLTYELRAITDLVRMTRWWKKKKKGNQGVMCVYVIIIIVN